MFFFFKEFPEKLDAGQEDILTRKRHSLAHLLAAALVEMYPGTKLAIGPAIEDGFYYDAELPVPLSVDDLPAIEEKMRALLAEWDGFKRRAVSREEALAFFGDNVYKRELIEELSAARKDIFLYSSGSFTDLCGGGHVDSVREIDADAFTLRSVAGAYWRGDENNTMLTRVYGIAFDTKEELDTHLQMLEEAKKRDHRKLGKELGLFSSSKLVGSGLPLFTPKGAALRNALEDSLSVLLEKYGYEKVWIPHLTKPDLYKKSGHWEKFGDELLKVYGKNEEFVLKPMNCPHHTQIYASSPKSYNDLPVRYAEFTTVYRDEQKGELLGLTRVLSITQDDGHIFCTEEQVQEEVASTIAFVEEFYTALGFFRGDDCEVCVSVRGDEKEKYLGDDAVWDRAEDSLKRSLEERGMPFRVDEGEAAFYGPKIDFIFRDSLNRQWQLATIQLDFVMPERFDLSYIDSDNKKRTPIMIHRAISGSLERFLGVMIEHFAGDFPFFLAPVQARVLPIGADCADYAKDLIAECRKEGLRVDGDFSEESVGKKIAKTHAEKIPVKLVVGRNEMGDGTVTVESAEDGKRTVPIAEAIEEMAEKARVFG